MNAPWDKLLRHSIFLFAVLAFAHLGCEGHGSEQASVPEWTLVRELTVGSLDGREDALTRIGSLALGTQEEVFVSQPDEFVVRVFDPEGHARGKFAGQGDGPGEFRGMGPIRRLADTLYVFDFRNGRTSLFSEDGRFLYSFQYAPPELGEGLWPVPTWLLEDGTVLVDPGYVMAAVADGTVSEIPVVRTTREGEVLDTVATYPLRSRPFAGREGSTSFGSDNPFPYNPKIAYSPSQRELIIVDAPVSRSGERTTFSVLRLSLGGDTVGIHRIPFEPVELPGPVKDSVIDAEVEGYTRGPSPLIRSRRTARTDIEKAWDLPDFYPPVSSVQIGSDGRIWIRREDLPGPLLWWDLLAPQGTVVARFRLPSGLDLRDSRGAVVWGTERDQLGVDYLVRFRITEHAESPGG
jgi:hypothetical protein